MRKFIFGIIIKITHLPIAIRTHIYPIINKYYFLSKGVQIGNNPLIFNKIYLIGNGHIKIGDNFCFTSGDCINPISSNLRGCIYTEKNATISIGNNVGMSSTRLWIRSQLKVGNNVKIGGNVLIIDTDSHPIDFRLRKEPDQLDSVQSAIKSIPITIEDDVWIGANCTILKGVTIGSRSIIGAGSVVTKSIPADCIAAGNPAKVIKQIKNE